MTKIDNLVVDNRGVWFGADPEILATHPMAPGLATRHLVTVHPPLPELVEGDVKSRGSELLRHPGRFTFLEAVIEPGYSNYRMFSV